MSEQSLPPGFRRLEPVELWSKQIKPEVRLHQFIKIALAKAQQNQQRYIGFTATNESGIVHSFTRSRYPRAKYGIATVSECQSGMQVLADNFGVPVESDPQQSGFRVVLGLLEDYRRRRPHTTAEVIDALDSSYDITATSTFVASATPLGPLLYEAPAVIIRSSVSNLSAVFKLAEQFGQERFVVEDFDLSQAWMVETPHCKEPDAV